MFCLCLLPLQGLFYFITSPWRCWPGGSPHTVPSSFKNEREREWERGSERLHVGDWVRETGRASTPKHHSCVCVLFGSFLFLFLFAFTFDYHFVLSTCAPHPSRSRLDGSRRDRGQSGHPTAFEDIGVWTGPSMPRAVSRKRPWLDCGKPWNKAYDVQTVQPRSPEHAEKVGV